jgi:phosphohistidine phosphatase
VKTLYIVRHAKSSWEDPNLNDFARPLNHRGERDAVRMGNRLRDLKISPQTIFTSPALRALTTAEVISRILECQYAYIQEKSLYHADEDTLLKIIRRIPDSVITAMVVGHNPGLTNFVNDLLDAEIENIPTAGVVSGQLNIDSWKDADWNCGEIIFFDYPKKT